MKINPLHSEFFWRNISISYILPYQNDTVCKNNSKGIHAPTLVKIMAADDQATDGSQGISKHDTDLVFME